jgi:hypothetical protein
MDRIEQMILAKHGIKRTTGANAADAPKDAPKDAKAAPAPAEKTNGEGKKVPHLPAKPAN